jgi:hypothetical protein
MADALVVMAKSPVPGLVKTRLVPALSEVEAATLYTNFIADTFNSIVTLADVHFFLALARNDSQPSLNFHLPGSVKVIEQSGDTLGFRLLNVFKSLFNEGYARVAVIGSDSPDLPIEFIREAFTKLSAQSTKVVLGPSEDGGYYLIALSRVDERPFAESIKWSTPSVLADTVELLGDDAIFLKPWYDIDEPKDILRLARTGRAKKSLDYILETGILDRCREFASRMGEDGLRVGQRPDEYNGE